MPCSRLLYYCYDCRQLPESGVSVRAKNPEAIASLRIINGQEIRNRDRNEENFSAKHHETKADPWISSENEDEEWKGGPRSQKGKGKEKAHHQR